MHNIDLCELVLVKCLSCMFNILLNIMHKRVYWSLESRRPNSVWAEWVSNTFSFRNLASELSSFQGCAWIRLGQVQGIFLPNPPQWVKKNSTQPNPTHHLSPTQPTWVGLGRVEPLGWAICFITIIIKLSRKKFITLAT